MGKRNLKRKKEEIAEDCCFFCKDGGNMRVCDFKDCLKTYHAECVNEDASFLTSNNNWCCESHYCCVCRKASKFMCFFCPTAVCGKCYYDVDFALVKRNRGFCRHCSKLAFLIEKNADVDSDGEKIDMKDPATFESYFVEYYEVIKRKEGLNSQNAYIARDLIKNRKKKCDMDSYEIGDGEDDSGESDVSNFMGSDSDDLDSTTGVKSSGRKKKCMKKLESIKGKVGKDKNKDFDGWGSRSLVDSLKSIGRDTTKAFSELDVTSLIIDYCHKNKLFDPMKKKRRHFNSTTKSCLSVVSQELPSGFAAIISSNLKLVYLKRNLIEELLKQPENFDGKVLGSFVRTKTDPNDYLQNNSHLLSQVIGINRSSKKGEINQEILLQLPNVPKDVPISKISDDDFSEEECQDLYRRMSNGLLKKPTTLELEQKARTLHEDVTKHYMDRKMKLESPSEQSRLLSEIPKVIPEMVDTNLSPEDSSRKDNLEFPSAQSRSSSEIPEVTPEMILSTVTTQEPNILAGVNSPIVQRLSYSAKIWKTEVVVKRAGTWFDGIGFGPSQAGSWHFSAAACDFVLLVSIFYSFFPGTVEYLYVQPSNTKSDSFDVDHRNLSVNMDVNQTIKERQTVTLADSVKATAIDVIMLSDSDEDDPNIKVTSAERKEVETPKVTTAGRKGVENPEVISAGRKRLETPEISSWLCSGVYGGGIRGPFSLSVLKLYCESKSANSSPLDFKVWKTGESEREAIPLRDALRLFSPQREQ
ncbi:hypothetical protein KIW84_054131 [Lathyrus oleraceus]|uniref:Plus3 domain-containing protein n=1 Tax=Pisum sativum TaxID=3888 RepID=A0A9D4WS98_PEA|nr:hypothetical protein KIW84_054131 [Pisum sativum]